MQLLRFLRPPEDTLSFDTLFLLAAVDIVLVGSC